MVCIMSSLILPNIISAMDDIFRRLSCLCLLLIAVGVLYYSLQNKLSKPNRKHNASLTSRTAGMVSVVGFIRNRHRFLDWLTDMLSATNSNTFVIPSLLFGIHGVATANPANLEHILKTNFDNYPKGEGIRFLFHDFLGGGIFNADGEQWRMQRKSASHEFNTKSLRKFVVETVQWEISNRLMVVLKEACDSGVGVNLYHILKQFGFDNICRVAFGVDVHCLNSNPSLPTPPFQQAFDDAAEISFGRFFYLLPYLTVGIKRMFDIGCERRLREAIGQVDEFAMDIVRSRRNEMSHHPEREDLLSRFMAALPDDRFDCFLKDMVVNIMLAGRDTTSSALTWFFWLISSHPHVEEAIRSEILQLLAQREALPDKDEATVFSFEELKGMQYLHAALCESLRLYPPVPVDSKIAAKDDVLPDGTLVRKGSFVAYSIYSMGRMENLWGKDCREFKPERWLKGGCFEVQDSFKFPVFNAGPRVCLGKEMAFIQMKAIVASILHLFTLKVEEGHCPAYSLSITLRMEGGLPVTVTRR